MVQKQGASADPTATEPKKRRRVGFSSVDAGLEAKDCIKIYLGEDSGAGGKRVVEVPSEYEPEMSFVMFSSKAGEATGTVQIDENQPNQEEQLQQLVEERVKEIKSVAEKVSSQISLAAEAS